jgi:hypothetical protein
MRSRLYVSALLGPYQGADARHEFSVTKLERAQQEFSGTSRRRSRDRCGKDAGSFTLDMHSQPKKSTRSLVLFFSSADSGNMTATSEEMRPVTLARRAFRGWIAKKKTILFHILVSKQNEVHGLASIAGDSSSPRRRAVHWEVRPPRATGFISLPNVTGQSSSL